MNKGAATTVELIPSRPVMKTPRGVDIEITSRCNLHCRYCYYYENPSVKYRDLPAQEWQEFFDELGSCAVMNITLQGGEPFIRKDLPILLEGIVRNRMRFNILSNGALIDDSIAAFLAETGRCDGVQVSIDGSCAQIHDTCRGSGSFEGAVRGIRTLQRHGVTVHVRVTVHHYNVGDLEETARFLLEELALSGFGVNSAGYLGRCRENSQNVQLTTRQRQHAMKVLLELSERYPGRIQAQAGPLAESRYYRRMEEARARGDAPWPNGGRLTGCGCTSSKIGVRADGMIGPCLMLPHMELGRINREPLRQIWQENPPLNALRCRGAIPLADFDFCEGCPYIPYCTGNCPALAYSLMGKVNHPSPDACLRRFLEAGGKIV